MADPGTFLVDPVVVGGDVDITIKPFGDDTEWQAFRQDVMVDPTSGTRQQQGEPGGSLFSSYSPEEQTEVRKVAAQLGVHPEAIAGVSRIETGEGFRNLHSPGSQYHGLFQMNVGEGYRPGMSRVEQIQAYGQMAKDKDYLGKLQAAGIDISAMSPSQQAAILQGFQFAPNAKAWLNNFDVQTTATRQSSELKYGKSVNQMAQVFDELMTPVGPGPAQAAVGSTRPMPEGPRVVVDYGSGVTKSVQPVQAQRQPRPFLVDATQEQLQADIGTYQARLASATPTPQYFENAPYAQEAMSEWLRKELLRRDPGELTPLETIEERFPQKAQERLGPPVTRFKPDRSRRPIIPGEWMPDPQGLKRTVRQI